ncbi:transporter substrate-binding domain-containing protein [Paucibacter sp. APW11]|uniref:Transporter substrate-binding domain-containing protein n=1 Tax=Roseateles aquae TaxID=3077235 RepID=A0ABU3PBS2_9BURK|nr:transporter substrate-binding domain-containing protein [Paucibacter sp. APW11]MDT9000008.1 transporter substrate-binding domain-containing protein [Paucibacter sp. APW11]
MITRRAALAMASLLAFDQARALPLMRISTLLDPDPATTIATRVLREAYRRLGHDIEVLAMPGERSLLSANAGETDGELYRRAGIERHYVNLMMVPVALQNYEIVAFSKNRQIVVNGWESLRPYKVGFVKGIKIIEENTAGMQTETVATLQQAFTKLELGRSELILANRISGLASLRLHAVSGVHLLQPPLAVFPVYHYLHKRHQALLPRLSAVLRELEQERFIQRVQDEVLSEF